MGPGTAKGPKILGDAWKATSKGIDLWENFEEFGEESDVEAGEMKEITIWILKAMQKILP